MIEKTQQTLQQGEISGNVDKNDIIRVSIDMNNIKELIIERDHSVYLPIYYASEVGVANKVKLLLKKSPREFRYSIDECIRELESKYNISYAKTQKEAFHTLPTTNMMVITGGPGTGRLLLLKEL